jgi:LPS O-antigen subunit length determinant protein (WzzB/FepE family)
MTTHQQDNDAIDVWKFIEILWAGKILIIGLATLAAIVSVTVSLNMTPIFRAEILLSPVEQDKAIGSQLGQVAGFMGINIPNGSNKTDKSIAILKSKIFQMTFIRENNLLPIFYAEIWDEKNKTWMVEKEQIPTMLEAYNYFKLFNIIEKDASTSLVTLSVEWSDASLATIWANKLVGTLNSRMREEAIIESQKNLTYLESQLVKTQLTEVKRSIYELIENEMKNMVYVNAQEEYVFEVLDPAIEPERKVRPVRSVIVLVSVFLAGLLSSLIVIGQFIYRSKNKTNHSTPGTLK